MTRRHCRDGGSDRREAGEGLAVEGMGQDRLHRVVAILAGGARASAGGLQARGAVALAQAQDALGAAEAIQGAIAEERLDEAEAGGADLRGAGLTPGGGLQEEIGR